MGSNVNAIAEKYPSITAVATQLDLQLMAEPEYSADEGDVRQIGVQFYIGDHGDRSVNIPPTEATPRFGTLGELEGFCARHRHQYAVLAETDEWPNNLWWEK